MPEFDDDFTDIARPLVAGDKTIIADGDNAKTMTVGAIATYAASVSPSSTTVIWRPTEGSPSGNIYATWAALAAAIATKAGSVTIVCDHSLSSTFTVTAAAYPLIATELRFVGWKNSPATVAIADGVTFTGGTIRSLVIDGVRLEWRGTGSPLIPAVTTTLHIDLYRGGVLGADNGNSAAMLTIDEFAIVRLHDPLCAIEVSNYELFLITDTSLLQVYLAGFLNTVSGDFARSSGSGPDDGAVQVLFDSCQGPTYPSTQTNLGGTYSKTDGVPFSPVITALDARVDLLEVVADRTVVWRPTEPSPSGNVYATAAAALASLATQIGVVTLVLDSSLSSTFTIPAGAYPLVCTELRFVGPTIPQVVIEDGVTLTGGTIRSFVVDGATLLWQGTGSPLIPTTTTYFPIDLYRFGGLYASSSTAVMFAFDGGGGTRIRMHDPECLISAADGYELFSIASGRSLTIYKASQAEMSGSFVRGPGSCTVVYDSTGGFGVELTQANVSSYTLTDTAQGGDLGPRVTDLEGGQTPDANIERTTGAGPVTLGSAITKVFQANASAMTYVLPAALKGMHIDIIKETVNAGAITLDPAGSDTIHGSASNYVLDGSDYVSSATTFRRAWSLDCAVDGNWLVS